MLHCELLYRYTAKPTFQKILTFTCNAFWHFLPYVFSQVFYSTYFTTCCLTGHPPGPETHCPKGATLRNIFGAEVPGHGRAEESWKLFRLIAQARQDAGHKERSLVVWLCRLKSLLQPARVLPAPPSQALGCDRWLRGSHYSTVS